MSALFHFFYSKFLAHPNATGVKLTGVTYRSERVGVDAMLTRLRFKNWRSLRDVTIDNLTPITVFVGANSSGKTNILDALHFLRYVIDKSVIEAVYAWHGLEKIHTVGVPANENTELEFSFLPKDNAQVIDYCLKLRVENETAPFWFFESASGMNEPNEGDGNTRDLAGYFTSARGRLLTRDADILLEYVTRRWQLLRENFMPPFSMESGDPARLFVIDPDARNVPYVLDFMEKIFPEQYEDLQSDLRWLLKHVGKLETKIDEREARLVVREGKGQEAPSISTGTARSIAILTALHMMNWRIPDMPALIAIEEPEVGIHPLLFSRLIELFRLYTERGNRQIFLTTHNPMLLNMFKPEEVRIVERDEEGITTVNPVNQDVVNVWYDKYGEYSIGDVWTTRLLGGVPE